MASLTSQNARRVFVTIALKEATPDQDAELGHGYAGFNTRVMRLEMFLWYMAS